MANIRYSFIIPHRNSPQLLYGLLETIPERDDIEVIIVDDNSKDSLRPQVKRNHTDVVYLDASHSNGAGHARNVGLARATGEWLLFPDCDDSYQNGFCNILDKFAHSDLDVLYFNFRFIDGKTGEELPFGMKQYYDEFDGSQLSIDKIKYLNIPPWTKMVKSSFVQEHNLQFEEVINGNDMFFSFSAGYCAKQIEVIKDELYCYVKNEKGLSNSRVIPVEAHLCRIIHVFQLRKFYTFIGHTEWRPSGIMRVMRSVRAGGIKVLFAFIAKIPYIICHSNDLVRLVREKKR